MYDDICQLFNDCISSGGFDKYAKLKKRQPFLRSIESMYNTQSSQPSNCTVKLHNNTLVTVPVFDIKAMIISLLSDNSLMDKNNFAEGHNIFNGNVDENNPSNSKYGEVHTGDAWLPARNRHCKTTDVLESMPIALIVFGNKSHTDLHGSLSLMPIIFTLSLFNRNAHNTHKFWRPIGYIPNLSYGKGVADKTPTKDKIQDEHMCLSTVFKSLRKISKEKGFNTVVIGRNVHMAVWNHYFIGDTEGNNKWLGQYPGNKEGV